MAADDERLALEGLLSAIRETAGEADVTGFEDPEELLSCAKQEKPDVVFLDIEMNTASGLTLAEQLQAIHPKVNIIFVTWYREYMDRAFYLHASGYVLKPVTPEKIRHELDHLRFPQEQSSSRMRIRTFGKFDVFAGGHPVTFGYAKTRELLAVLVDAGGGLCSMNQISDILWEDEAPWKHASYLRNLLADLRNVLERCGCPEVLIRRKGMAGIDRTAVDCDLFALQEGDPLARTAFRGEYMSQYSWAEVTLARLLAIVPEAAEGTEE